MTKSELVMAVASAAIPDGDPRLDAAAEALAGRKAEASTVVSLRLFKMGEASKETGLSRCTLWRAIRDGRIKTVELRRGSRRIPQSELERFIRGAA
jgi:excisionase family DNA binding protein